MKFEELTREQKLFAALIASMDDEQFEKFRALSAFLELGDADSLVENVDNLLDLAMGLREKLPEAIENKERSIFLKK